jgi:hypothetical protein
VGGAATGGLNGGFEFVLLHGFSVWRMRRVETLSHRRSTCARERNLRRMKIPSGANRSIAARMGW